MWGRTNVGAEICRCENAYAQISIDLANDLDGIVGSKVGVLSRSQYWSHGAAAWQGRLTRFRCRLMDPAASMVACSPRSCVTLPRMRTVW